MIRHTAHGYAEALFDTLYCGKAFFELLANSLLLFYRRNRIKPIFDIILAYGR